MVIGLMKSTEEEKAKIHTKTFEETIPNFLKKVEPVCVNRRTKWLFTDKISYADFWIGTMYVDNFTNPNIPYGKGDWEKLLAANPGFDAFGKQFVQEMTACGYLKTRPDCPF